MMGHDKVAMRVVTFLGSAGIIGLLGVIFLVAQATRYETIDPSTVALVAGVSTIVGALFGSLGSILASTGKGAPQPVVVENAPSDPVPTTPAPPVPPVDGWVGDEGHADPVGIALLLLFVCVLLLALGVIPPIR